MGPDVDGAHGAPIDVRLTGRRRIISPREATLPLRRSTRLGRGDQLPLGLGGQTPPAPAGVGVALVPVDMDHGPVRFERHPLVEVPALPPPLGITPPIQ